MMGKLLGHTQVQSTARYAHLARDTVKASAARTADSIDRDLAEWGRGVAMAVMPSLPQAIHRAEKIGCLVPGQGNVKCPRIQTFVCVSQVHKFSEVAADGFRQFDASISKQELCQPEYIVAMLPDIPSVDVPTCRRTSGEVKKCAGLERYEQGLVDDRDAIDLPTCCLNRLEIGIVQQDCRKADNVLVCRYPCEDRVFGQVEIPRPSRK